MASAWECPFGSHSYLEVELEKVYCMLYCGSALSMSFLRTCVNRRRALFGVMYLLSKVCITCINILFDISDELFQGRGGCTHVTSIWTVLE